MRPARSGRRRATKKAAGGVREFRVYRVQDSGFWEFFWLHVPESETEVLRVSNTAFSVFRLALSRFVVLESYWLVWRC